MKRISAVLLIFSMLNATGVLASDGETAHFLQSYLDTDTTIKPNTDAFYSFLDQLEKKQDSYKHPRDFVRYVFHKTHQKFLKHFETYSSFSQLLKNGSYNCLTGTSLYALILNHFQIEHSIIETNYHIFILVHTDGETILLEATDPINGFVESKPAIENKLSLYRKNTLQEASSVKGTQYQFSFNLWEVVSLNELTGLLYFNNAVLAYNNHLLEKSILSLTKASMYRPSERIQEFASIVILTVANSELTPTTKESLLYKLRTVRRQSAQMLTASLSH